MKKILAFALASSLLFSACGPKNEEKIARDGSEKYLKEVEVFDLEANTASLSFSQSAIVSAESRVQLSPQSSGRIIEVKVKLGDKVKKGEVIAILGDSLNTDLLDLQYQSALKTFENAKTAREITDASTINSVQSAQIAVKTAYQAYLNALKSKSNAENSFEEQYDNAQLAIETAEDSYDRARDSYNDAEDMVYNLRRQIDDLENQLRQLASDDLQRIVLEYNLSQLESALASAEIQSDNAKFSMKTAKNGIDQAENASILLQKNFDSQIDQLNFAIQGSINQYQTAVMQFQNAANAAEQQRISADNQLIQAESALESSKLSDAQKDIRSPIDGTITELNAIVGNLVAPGQNIARVENGKNFIIRTSVNIDEAKLINIGDTVQIDNDGRKFEGTVSAKSSSANSISKKIELEISANAEADVIPESFVKIRFNPENSDKIFIPLEAVFTESGKKIAKIFNKNSTVEYREIKVGKVIGSFIEVLEGLEGKEKVIKAGTAFIEEGEQVTLTK